MVSGRIRKQISYPKVIAVMAVVCAFVMVKFQSPHPKFFTKHSSRKIRTASLANSQGEASVKAQSVDKAPVASSTIDTPKATAIGTAPENLLNTEVLENKNSNHCPLNFSKLGASIVAEQKVTEVTAYRSATTPHKKVQRHSAKKEKIEKRFKKVVSVVVPNWILEDLENSELNSQNGIDNPAPLDDLAMISFREAALSEVADVNPLIASAQWNHFNHPAFPFPEEHRMYIQESLFQKTSFADLGDKLKHLKIMARPRALKITAPKPKMAWSQLSLEIDSALTEMKAKENLSYVANADQVRPEHENTQTIEPTAPLSKIDSDLAIGQAPSEKETKPTEDETKDTLERAEASLKTEIPSLNQILSPSLAAVGTSDIDEVVTALAEKVAAVVTTQKNEGMNTPPNFPAPTQDTHEGDDNSSSLGGMIYGEIEAEEAALAWLTSHRGHIELYLNRVGSKDPQDTIFLIDYQFPQSGRTFELDGTGMQGNYQLVAGVYTPTSAVPVAQIVYPKTISADNYKDNIYLVIKKEALIVSPGRDEAQRQENSVPLTLTLFDGAPGNYRKPKSITGEISVVGFPELGTFNADKEGNIRINKLPVGSEYVIEAKAPGYYPTRQIVPIFSTAAYAPIYLIEKDKVEAITKYFTKKPQEELKAVLMGRVYNLKTKAPLAGETLSLSHRKGQAVYFGALPDLNLKTTVDTGLFGFYNIESSMRSVARDSEKHSLLLSVDPNHGYFIELGRGGVKNFSGRLSDPFAGHDVVGTVQLVGDSFQPLETLENGKFKIENLDLPPGIITLEAVAEGYPRTWYTVPWNTREPEKERSLYMIERDLLRESAQRVARVGHDKNTGVIIGGAHTSLFKKGRRKIQITLLKINGNVMPAEHGPFSLSQIPKNKAAFLLTAKNPGFAFFNVPPGEYLLKMAGDSGATFRSHVVRVGVERVSVVVN